MDESASTEALTKGKQRRRRKRRRGGHARPRSPAPLSKADVAALADDHFGRKNPSGRHKRGPRIERAYRAAVRCGFVDGPRIRRSVPQLAATLGYETTGDYHDDYRYKSRVQNAFNDLRELGLVAPAEGDTFGVEYANGRWACWEFVLLPTDELRRRARELLPEAPPATREIMEEGNPRTRTNLM